MRTSINILLVLLCTLPLNSDVVVVVGRGVPAGGGTTATDSFERTSADPLSTTMSDGTSTWTSGQGATGDIKIVDDSDATGSVGADCSVRVLSPTFAANHKATITYGTVPTGAGVCARINSTTDSDCYLVYTSSTTQLQFYKVTDNGSLGFSQIGANVAISAVAAGDTISISAEGTGTVTIKAFRNGVEVASRTDSTSAYDAGQPGLWSNQTTPRIEAFTAIDL